MNPGTTNDLLINMLKSDVEVMRKPGDEHDYSLKEEITPCKKGKQLINGGTVIASKIEEAQLLLDFANGGDCAMAPKDEPLITEEQMEYEWADYTQEDGGGEYTTAPLVDQFSESERSEVIGLKEGPTTCSSNAAPEDVVHTSEVENQLKSPLDKIEIDPKYKTSSWVGKSIYANLPPQAVAELDFLLRFGHSQMVAVIKAINAKFPVDINYNPNKSNARLENPSEYRNQNNSASRRSRLRRKFGEQIYQYFLQYMKNENAMLERQEIFCAKMVIPEEVALVEGGFATVDQLKTLRAQCGLL